MTAVIDELARAFEAGPFEVFLAALRRRAQGLSVGLVDGRVVAKAEAGQLAARVIALVAERVLPALEERPGDAVRALDVLRAAGFLELEERRAICERARADRYPPPPAATWGELAELRALAAREPALCRLGPPVQHVEFAAQLRMSGVELPGALLALYAATGHIALTCRRVPVSAGGICAGEALRVRDGRLVLHERTRRQPATLHVEQPGLAIAEAAGSWWLVLEDERATVRRPFELPALLAFALRRVEAPSLEVLLTDLSWSRFFA